MIKIKQKAWMFSTNDKKLQEINMIIMLCVLFLFMGIVSLCVIVFGGRV